MSECIPQVARFAAELIAIDTTNTGGPGTVGEGEAARYVAAQLIQAGGAPVLIEPAPNRTSVLLRFAGTGDTAAQTGLVVHGHLDVVPADPADWSVDPFQGLIRDGHVWGRGAIDMKGTDAVMLAVALDWLRTGVRPRRDVVFVWLADEEAGGALGAGRLCREEADLIAGCVVAIGEVGGFSIPVGRQTLYPIMTAERARARLSVSTSGTAGHGAIRRSDNPIAALARTITALDELRFPALGSPSVTGFFTTVGALWGVDLAAMPLDSAVRALGPLGPLIAPSIRHSIVPTMVGGGSAGNVLPGTAQATFDCRILPGHVDEFRARVTETISATADVTLEVISPGMQVAFDGDVVEAMAASLSVFDPSAVAVPYMVSASTDAVHFAAAGLATYGFSPLRLPTGFAYASMFHGPDERVPIDGLLFGVDVLDHFLRSV